MKALWKNSVLAESDETIVVEGNHYFPQDSVEMSHLQPSVQRTACPWKGVASYYDVEVDGEQLQAAAWCYPDPKPAARQISGYVAFWKAYGSSLRTRPSRAYELELWHPLWVLTASPGVPVSTSRGSADAIDGTAFRDDPPSSTASCCPQRPAP